MIELSFNTLAGISLATKPALYLPFAAVDPDAVIPFCTPRGAPHGFYVEFYAWQTVGGAIGHRSRLAAAMTADMLEEIDRGIIRDINNAILTPAEMRAQEVRALNEALFEQLSRPGMDREAIDRVNDFTRSRMREDGFYRRIMPPIPIQNDELDRSIDTDRPVRVVRRNPLRDRLVDERGTRRPNAAARRAARRRLRFGPPTGVPAGGRSLAGAH